MSAETLRALNLRGHKLDESKTSAICARLNPHLITSLDLSNNLLRVLHTERGPHFHCLFEGFTRLEQLDLSGNPIEHIHSRSMQSLRALRSLTARNCELSKECSFRFLKNLPALEHLDISQHRAHELRPATLLARLGRTFPALESIDLRPIGWQRGRGLTPGEVEILRKHCPALRLVNTIQLPEKENVENSAVPVNTHSALSKSFSRLAVRPRNGSRVRHATLKNASFDSSDFGTAPASKAFLQFIDRLPQTPFELANKYLKK